jgi:glycosyltransferase involved in cell wall biosynthesis
MGENMKNMLIKAPCRGDTGYATVNRNIIINLHKLGYNIFLEPTHWAENNMPVTRDEDFFLRQIESRGLSNIPVYDDAIILNLVMPELYRAKMRGYNLGWYIFEADRVPATWVDAINSMDGIVVPTEFHKQQVLDIGFTGKTYLLREGINPEMYHPGIEPMIKTGKFTFLTVAIAQERKHWREIITCYLEEFDKEKACLILKLAPTGYAPANKIQEYILKERKRTGSNAEIILRTKSIPGSLAGLYASANCYVSLGAEGWDCPLAESIACGCAGIALDWGGHTEWFTEEMGLKVKVKDVVPVKNMQGFSGYQDPELKWAYPDLDDTKKAMRTMYENHDMTKSLGLGGSKVIHEKYNWNKTVSDFSLDLKQSCNDYKTVINTEPKLSVAMITKNVNRFMVDDKNVFASNLKILQELADETVIVDSGSTDGTVETAEKYGAKVYQYADHQETCGLCGGTQPENICKASEKETKQCFSKFRKASFNLCSHEWILRLDSDEVIRREDISYFRQFIKRAHSEYYNVIAVAMPTLNFFGRIPYYKCGWDGNFSWFPDFHTRLYRNIKECKEWFAPAHEGVCVMTPRGWLNIINHSQTIYLPEPIAFHYGYLKPDSELRNIRYKKMGAKTHDLSYNSFYSCGILKWEGAIPNLTEGK